MKNLILILAACLIASDLFAQSTVALRSPKEIRKSVGAFTTKNNMEELKASNYTVETFRVKDGGTGTFLKFEEEPLPADAAAIPKPVISVYPNPVLSKMKVTVKNAEHFTVEIFNLLGQRCCIMEADKKASVEIDMSSYTAGLYILQCSASGEITTFKIVKEEE